MYYVSAHYLVCSCLFISCFIQRVIKCLGNNCVRGTLDACLRVNTCFFLLASSQLSSHFYQRDVKKKKNTQLCHVPILTVFLYIVTPLIWDVGSLLYFFFSWLPQWLYAPSGPQQHPCGLQGFFPLGSRNLKKTTKTKNKHWVSNFTD